MHGAHDASTAWAVYDSKLDRLWSIIKAYFGGMLTAAVSILVRDAVTGAVHSRCKTVWLPVIPLVLWTIIFNLAIRPIFCEVRRACVAQTWWTTANGLPNTNDPAAQQHLKQDYCWFTSPIARTCSHYGVQEHNSQHDMAGDFIVYYWLCVAGSVLTMVILCIGVVQVKCMS